MVTGGARSHGCYVADDHGVILSVRVTTRASRDGVDNVGVHGDGNHVAHIRVRAVPSDGKANAAVIGLLSKLLRRPKSRIRLVSGAASRIKRFRIEGDSQAIGSAIEAWPKT